MPFVEPRHKKFAEKPQVLRPQPSDNDGQFAVDEFDYPEGGWEAWTVALGSWCAMTAGLGLVNSTGVFQAYVGSAIFPSYGEAAVGWIFGIYVFVSYFFGVQTGPIFDARGPRLLMTIGMVCILIGLFTLSVCTEYYQFILALSILEGIGCSFLFTPAMGAISHWFNKRRGMASGFAFIGSGTGGVLFPLMVQSLIPKVGWPWTIRIIGFVHLVLCVLSIILCRSRLPPKRGDQTSWRDMVPDPRIFLDKTGAMAVTSFGVFLVEWAYFVPITYIPSYYLARQGIAKTEVADGPAAFAYQLLAIANGVSCLGRFLPGVFADKFGRYNTMILSTLVCLVAVFSLWLPDCILQETPNLGLLIAFVVFFGFASGSNISLTPTCVGQLCSTQEYGRYYAAAYTVVSFGCLTSIPIAGNLIAATGDQGRRAYWGLIVFTGLSYLGSFLCFLYVRVRMRGWDWTVVW